MIGIQNFIRLIFIGVLSCLLMPLSAAAAEPITRSGYQQVANYHEAVKIDGRKEVRYYKVDYNWDSGMTRTRSYNKKGKLISESLSAATHAPSEQEVEQAIQIVSSHPLVNTIRAKQGGISIQGGFAQAPIGKECAKPARCLQIFLFDAENIVRHMLVDLRRGVVVDTDFVAPQYREQNNDK